jgi:hypothetical protein
MLPSEVAALDIGFYQQLIETKRLEDCLSKVSAVFFKPLEGTHPNAPA